MIGVKEFEVGCVLIKFFVFFMVCEVIIVSGMELILDVGVK